MPQSLPRSPETDTMPLLDEKGVEIGQVLKVEVTDEGVVVSVHLDKPMRLGATVHFPGPAARYT